MAQTQDTSPDSTSRDAPRPFDLTGAVKNYAQELGFDACRIVPVETALHADFFELWLDGGRAGEMSYLERYADKRRDPQQLTPKGSAPLRSIIVLAVSYHQFDLPLSLRDDSSRGIIASYAWSDDYHDVIRPLLHELDAFVRHHSGRKTSGKCLIDTGPVLERDWAQRAGIGFTGKNCCTIVPGDGSWFFLATVLVPEVLAYDRLPREWPAGNADPIAPSRVMEGLAAQDSYGSWDIPVTTRHGLEAESAERRGTCGRCARCLNACPTAAFAGPYHLDPRRCISYWTIEAREPTPRALRTRFGNRIFGCDICQAVCPWNQRLDPGSPIQKGLRARQEQMAIPLLEGFAAERPYWLDEEAFRSRFRRSPLLRPKRGGMLRNVCVALGNWADPVTVPALSLALEDPNPLARGHAAWALGRIARFHRHIEAAERLVAAYELESVDWVRAEITASTDRAGDAEPAHTPDWGRP